VSGERILIIDDEPVVLEACSDVLASWPVTVATAADGGRGLQLVEELEPDLVFVDLKMPGISGFEVLERIRERDPTIVTVVITGYATVGSAVDAMKEGAYDFLPKPFTPDQLRLIARRGLEKRALVLETLSLRREQEALREAFAAIVAHELKSPLGAVQQNLFVLEAQLAGRLTDDEASRLARMKVRIGELLGMVDTWLTSVRVDLEAIEERFAPIEIAGPIAGAVEDVRPHALRKDIDVVVEAPQPSPEVLGDAATLRQAFSNVIGNGVKYSHGGTAVGVTVSARAGEVVVEIRDQGIGIAEQDRIRIFDDFFRAGGTGRAESGSGLGLAITNRIVRVHGGSIAVASEVGRGSTFTIVLPAPPGLEDENTTGPFGDPGKEDPR
jgi:signal transduction histidine kinase